MFGLYAVLYSIAHIHDVFSRSKKEKKQNIRLFVIFISYLFSENFSQE